MSPINQLQAYLRQSARQRYEAVSVPPFTCFFHPVEAFEHFNYAIPDEPLLEQLNQPLRQLRHVFTERDRTPRFEFIAEYAPELEAALQADGFILEERCLLMVCTSETYQPAPIVSDLEILALTQDSPLPEIKALMAVQHEAFSMTKREPVSDDEVRDFIKWLGESVFFLGRYQEKPVAAGSLMPPVEGLAEVAGIATLADFRRRGIGTAMTGEIVRHAFEQGTKLALLTAADERAGRVYQRLGFTGVATALAYREPAVP